MIPRIIHQVWVVAEGGPPPPPRFVAAADTWREMHPGWAYRWWDRAAVEELFRRHRPDLLELYESYPLWVQRADAGRYLILHVYGGVYADLDIRCLRPFDALVSEDLVLAPTRPLGYSNDLMAARPRHPLFGQLLDGLPEARRRWDRWWVPPHFRVIGGSGPLALTRTVRAWRGRARLLTRGEYGHGAAEEALVQHLEGNTWAGEDTRLLSRGGRLLARARRLLPAVAGVLPGAAAVAAASTGAGWP